MERLLSVNIKYPKPYFIYLVIAYIGLHNWRENDKKL